MGRGEAGRGGGGEVAVTFLANMFENMSDFILVIINLSSLKFKMIMFQ